MMWVWPAPLISKPVAPKPFKAPRPIEGELHSVYLSRLAKAFEDWVNDKR